MNSRTIRLLKFGMVLRSLSSVTSFRLSLAVAVAARLVAGDDVAAELAAGRLAGAGVVVFPLVVALPQATRTDATSTMMTRVRSLLVAGTIGRKSFPDNEYLLHIRAVRSD